MSDFLSIYEEELRYLRALGEQFARENPQLAGELAVSGDRVRDPFVERLMEGFAFLSARVRRKLDAGFPEFAEHVLDRLHPQFNAPMPALATFQFKADARLGDLSQGVRVPRGTYVRSALDPSQRTQVTYVTAHDVVLWPLEIGDVAYLPNAGSVAQQVDSATVEEKLRLPSRVLASVRVRLDLIGHEALKQTAIDEVVFHVPSRGESLSASLLRQLLGDVLGVVAKAPDGQEAILPASCVTPLGTGASEALLPTSPRVFDGMRLMQEWFALPSRLSYVRVRGLAEFVRACGGASFDLHFLVGRSEQGLDQGLSRDALVLHATPAVNLFPRSFARIQLEPGRRIYPLAAERTRPLDFEVHSVQRVKGIQEGSSEGVELSSNPVELSGPDGAVHEHSWTYTVHRRPRIVSSSAKTSRRVGGYRGSDVDLEFSEPVFGEDGAAQVEVSGLCTNRDLPLLLGDHPSFVVDTAAPIAATTCLDRTRPRPSRTLGTSYAWKALSQLSLDHFPLLLEGPGANGASAEPLKAQLRLFCGDDGDRMQRLVDGIDRARARPVTRRVERPGPVAFARGVRLELSCDEAAFHRDGLYGFGLALHRYLSRMVSINSFLDLTLFTKGFDVEYARFEAEVGDGPVL